MKLLLAIVISSLIHLAWFLAWPLFTEAGAKTQQKTAPKLDLILSLTPTNAIAMPHLAQHDVVKKHPTRNKNTRNHESNNSKTATQTEPKTTREQPALADYLSPNDVEMLALPIKNIDASMLASQANQIIQVKLRLYIDEFGHVTHITPLADEASNNTATMHQTVDQLSQLLYQVPFTPAKRQHLDVKSYQDVAYQFELNT